MVFIKPTAACGDFPPGYLAFFELFNATRYHAAHDALEIHWLPVRNGYLGNFYKGLIQLAGAFHLLHLNRTAPALRLLIRSRELLASYPSPQEGLCLETLLPKFETWKIALKNHSKPPVPFLNKPISHP